jgi:hypothetical protein
MKVFKVRCINNQNTGTIGGFGIEVGKEYTVYSDTPEGYKFVEDPTTIGYWRKTRFERIEEETGDRFVHTKPGGIIKGHRKQEGLIASTPHLFAAKALKAALTIKFGDHFEPYEHVDGSFSIYEKNGEGFVCLRAADFAAGFLAALP